MAEWLFKLSCYQNVNQAIKMLVSRASRIFLYFRWEEEKNTSGHSEKYGVVGWDVPPLSCSPGHVVLGPHVPLGQLVLGPCVPPSLVSGYKVATLSSAAILSTKIKTSTCR